jgi:hypothetical protein
MMCRWSSQITSDCASCSFNPSRPLSPPPPLQLLPFLIPLSLSLSCLLPGTWSYRGVSKQLPLTQIIGINFAINPFLLFFPFIAPFPYIFCNILCRKNAHSFLPENYPRNLFSRSFLCYNFSFFLMSHANYLHRRN